MYILLSFLFIFNLLILSMEEGSFFVTNFDGNSTYFPPPPPPQLWNQKIAGIKRVNILILAESGQKKCTLLPTVTNVFTVKISIPTKLFWGMKVEYIKFLTALNLRFIHLMRWFISIDNTYSSLFPFVDNFDLQRSIVGQNEESSYRCAILTVKPSFQVTMVLCQFFTFPFFMYNMT